MEARRATVAYVSPCVKVAMENGIALITLSRPEARNALDADACAALGAAMDIAEADPAVRVVILTGEGNEAFSAGFDLRYAAAHPEVYSNPLFGSEIVRRALGPKPLIAAVNGLALGLGFELALACDLIIAARHSKFALPEPTVGLAAMGGGVVRLSRQIGLKRALGMALTSRMVSAEEGMQLGFVYDVADGLVVGAAQRLAMQVMRGGPLALAATKEMAYRGVENTVLDEALDPRRYPATMRVLKSADAQEGRLAFLQKRAPVWQNR